MLDAVLQAVGGVFYLLNKIFLSLTERSEKSVAQRWRIWAWAVYLMGLPSWVIIFISERNWIAASVEAAGAPAMVMGLVIALRGKGNKPLWLDRAAKLAIGAGFCYSLYDFGGITAFTQVLEIVLVAGFFIGTYQLAHQNPRGYVWYMLMNGSNAWLMGVQGYIWLTFQQLVSLVFIADAYRMNRIKEDS